MPDGGTTRAQDPAATPSGELPPAPAAPDVSPTPASQALVASLPGACGRWRGTPRRAQITFAKSGRLFATDPSTGRTSCIGTRASNRLEWGPLGDRLLLTAGVATAYGDTFLQHLPGDQRETTWSRPTGTSVIYVSHDGASLVKEDVETGAITATLAPLPLLSPYPRSPANLGFSTPPAVQGEAATPA